MINSSQLRCIDGKCVGMVPCACDNDENCLESCPFEVPDCEDGYCVKHECDVGEDCKVK